MKKKIISSMVLLYAIFLHADKIGIPLPANSLSTDNNGTLSAIEAHGDGVGIYVIDKLGASNFDNSAMNSLVFKYGAGAKEANIRLKEYVSSFGINADKGIAHKVGSFTPLSTIDGTNCDDGKDYTINDKYVNRICLGTNHGLPCDDKDFTTTNDVIINGICTGDKIAFTNNFNIVDAYPDRNVNWSKSGNRYTSTGQFSSKFFKLPTSGKAEIKLKVYQTGGYGMSIGISNVPSNPLFGNTHIGGQSRGFANSFNSSSSANGSGYTTNFYLPTTGYVIYFYMDIDQKKTIIKDESGKILESMVNIIPSSENFFFISDASSAATGWAEFEHFKTSN